MNEVMNKNTAILFAGQGSQYIGMAKDFYDSFDYVKTMYQEASDILGYDITNICFNPNELINQTRYTQPAVLVTSCVIYEVFKKEIKIIPTVIAGFSLGEYTGLYAAGVFDFKTIVNLIKYRAQFMDEAASITKGSMAAILGLDRNILEDLCNKVGKVQIANYNCPGQLVVGGEYDNVNVLCEKAKEAGAKRAVTLNVSGGFHTSLMSSAASKMYEIITKTNYQRPQIDIIMNCNAQSLDINQLPNLMKKQIESSVYFEDSIRNMINNYSVETFIEIGPGKVLSGLVKKIDVTKTTLNIDKLSDLQLLK